MHTPWGVDTATPADPSGELLETHLEFRDGGVWLVGLCPGCWEHVTVLAPRGPLPTTVTCENGHVLRVKRLRSEGSHHYVGG